MLSHPSIYMNRLKNFPFDVHVNDRIKKYRKRKPKSLKQTNRPNLDRHYFYFLKGKLTATVLEYFSDPEIEITLQAITPLSVAIKDEMDKLSKEYDIRVVEESEASNETVEQSPVEDIDRFTASAEKQISVEDTANSSASSKTSSDHLSYDPLGQRIPLENAANSSTSCTISSDSSSYHPLEKQMSVEGAANCSTSATSSSDCSSYHRLKKQMSVADAAHSSTFCITSSDSSSYHPLEKKICVEDAANSSSSSTISSRSSNADNSSGCMDCRDEDSNGLSFSEMIRQIKTLDCGEESRILTEAERSMLSSILSEVIRYSEIAAQMDLISSLGQLDGNKFNFRNFMTAQKEKELMEIMPMLSIRKQIEVFENLVAPELQDPVNVYNLPQLARFKIMRLNGRSSERKRLMRELYLLRVISVMMISVDDKIFHHRFSVYIRTTINKVLGQNREAHPKKLFFNSR